MEIAFVHTGEAHDRIHVRRADGSEVAWHWGAAGPPHDLVHWAVESELGLARGFWGLVAGGADFGFVNESGHSGERESAGLGDTTELMRAEAVVNSIQHGMAMDPPWSDLECLRWAATWCEQARTELPAGLDVNRYGELREHAEGWVRRYRELRPREALHVAFPS
jgi:hypothetical protein